MNNLEIIGVKVLGIYFYIYIFKKVVFVNIVFSIKGNSEV